MPFDVYSNTGEKLGQITALCNGIINNYLVELDHNNTMTSKIDREKYKTKAFKHFGLMSMTGKTKEKKLESFVEDFKATDYYNEFQTMKPEDMVMFKFLCETYTTASINSVHASGFDPEDKRFMLINPRFCGYNGMGLVINNELEDVPTIERTHFIDDRVFSVISCKIDGLVAHSYSELGLMGSGSLAQAGGYNHVHYTRIPAKSGNLTFDLTVKMPVMCREGDPIYLLMDNTFMVKNIYSDGTFYTCNIE